MCADLYVPLHQQKKEIQRKGQGRIGRASHGCLSIVIEGQHPRCLWCSVFVPILSYIADYQYMLDLRR